MLALLLAAVAVTTQFEGGSIGRVETVAPGHLRCAIKGQADQNNRNRQANWYYFRLTGLPKGEFRIDFTDIVGEYNFRPGARSVTMNSRPVYSYDNRTWRHFTDEQCGWDEQNVVLTVRFTPERSTVWIAHVQPYTKHELDRLLAIRHPHAKRESLGKTFRGRDLPLLTITDPSVPDASKKVVWLMARQHAWETGTSWVADGAVRFLLSQDADAARLRRTAIFKVIPVFDPDGVSEGAVRFNVNGYDNNRNWDAVNPKLMPEIAAARNAMLGWIDSGRRIDVFLAMHNTEGTDYVEGPVDIGGPATAAVANDLVRRLRELTNFHDPKSPRGFTGRVETAKGRMTVNHALFTERKVPAFLMELMVERHPKLGHPRTAREFSEFGTGLVKALAGAAEAKP
jgi:murein tripeptide amidase MpaA